MIDEKRRNQFGYMEWAGAFGDLGTLIPFVVGYIGVLKVDPFGVLFAFGTTMIICGAYYKTPFPVQPMKTIGAIAIAQTAVITPTAVYAAGLVTGLFWLVLGFTGTMSRIAKVIPRPVVAGIILGLGLCFMFEGVKMMSSNWIAGAAGLAGTLFFMTRRNVPTMFLLLVFGVLYGMLTEPDAVSALAAASIGLRIPDLTLLDLRWNDLFVGTVLLALPQLPLTLGNAVIGIREENNKLFPHQQVTEKGVAISTGLMNLAGSAVGGVPMCHGAGGMAGHVAFGARTGGAPIILGSILLTLALFFSSSVDALFRLFPEAILGVILFIAGTQLSRVSFDFREQRMEQFITLATAAFAVWNAGVAFLVGIIVFHIAKQGRLRFL